MVTMLEYFLSRDIGPSPNGKALDSDSSIFKVRILVIALNHFVMKWFFFLRLSKFICKAKNIFIVCNPVSYFIQLLGLKA